MSYIDKIKDRAKLDKKTIVLPESKDKRTLLAAAKIVEEGIADIIMIGNEEKITDGAGWLEVDLTGVTIIDPAETPKLDEYVNLLYETRKAKGMTPEKAREILLNDYLTFGIVMVKANDADGMVAAWAEYMELGEPQEYGNINPLSENTPYFRKYTFSGMEKEDVVATVGYYEGINELYLKISK